MLAHACQPALGVLRPVSGDQAARPGHDEGDEQRGRAARLGDRPRVVATRDGTGRIARLKGRLGKSPEGREDELDLADLAAGRQRLLEPAPGLAGIATPEGHEPDGVERADYAAATTAVDKLVPGALVGGLPVAGSPVEQGGRRRHHLAAVRLLDRVRVLATLGDRALGRAAV